MPYWNDRSFLSRCLTKLKVSALMSLPEVHVGCVSVSFGNTGSLLPKIAEYLPNSVQFMLILHLIFFLVLFLKASLRYTVLCVCGLPISPSLRKLEQNVCSLAKCALQCTVRILECIEGLAHAQLHHACGAAKVVRDAQLFYECSNCYFLLFAV